MNSNKTHGHDGVSIRKLKLCGSLIRKPLSLFHNYLRDEVFPNDWKKANVISKHKKGNKQLVSDKRLVWLLPICSKIFKKNIFDCIYDFLDQNCQLNANQSGFRPGESCIHYLIAITHNIFTAFDANPSLEVCCIFWIYTKPLIEFCIKVLYTSSKIMD